MTTRWDDAVTEEQAAEAGRAYLRATFGAERGPAVEEYIAEAEHGEGVGYWSESFVAFDEESEAFVLDEEGLGEDFLRYAAFGEDDRA